MPRKFLLCALILLLMEMDAAFAQGERQIDDSIFGPPKKVEISSTHPGVARLPKDLKLIVIPETAYRQESSIRPIGNIVRRDTYFELDRNGDGRTTVADLRDEINGFGPDRTVLPSDEAKVGERSYYSNGQLAEEKVYRFGFLFGIWRQYYENGQLFAERPYRNGMPDGVFQFYSEDGKLLGKSTLVNGSGVLREFKNRQFGSDDAVIPYRNGRIHGNRVSWDKYPMGDGDQLIECEAVTSYNDGFFEGWSCRFAPDGRVIESAFMSNGQLHGVYRWMDRADTPRSGYPKYFVHAKEVSRNQFEEAAKDDPILRHSLNGALPTNMWTGGPPAEAPLVRQEKQTQ